MPGQEPLTERSMSSARLLLLRSLNPDGEEFSSAAKMDWTGIPWDWLLERAKAHKVHPLFVARMDRHGFTESLHEDARRKLERVREEILESTSRAERTLRHVADSFDSRGIPFLIVKGRALAEKVYGNATLRVFSDVDVVVPQSQLEWAEDALVQLGYFLYTPPFVATLREGESAHGPGIDPDKIPKEEVRRLLRKHHHHFGYVLKRGDPRLPVEVHWTLTRPGTLRLTPESLWECATKVELCGRPMKTLNPEATLLHTAVHGMDQSPLNFKLLHLCDVVWLVERTGRGLRIDELAEMAGSWGAEGHIRCAVEAARAVFPFPLPETDRLFGRSRWSRTCLRLSGMDARLIDRAHPRTRLGRLTRVLFREFFWDLAFGRSPRAALRTLGETAARLPALVTRGSGSR